MLNKDGNRELVYLAQIEEIKPIDGYDRVEYARIGAGWWLIVRKEQFKVGDIGIYFEVDSKVPSTEPFEFLEKRNYKIKALKMCKVISQGLLMSADDFGWTVNENGIVTDSNGNTHSIDDESKFLTKILNVTYADDEDNARKAPSIDKYQKMEMRHRKLFKNKFIKWLMRFKFTRNILFALFGKKKDKKTDWPVWVVKTDEERVQNMSWLFPHCTTKWIATEKIDGTSTTFTMKNTKAHNLIVCSRNVVFDTPEKNDRCYYDSNVYLEMSEKYNIKDILIRIIDGEWKNIPEVSDHKSLSFVTIQGETYGGNIQKRNYGDEHRLAVFNIIFGFGDGEVVRLNPIVGSRVASEFGLPYVPIVEEDVTLPATCDEVVAYAHGTSAVDGSPREGIVFRSYDGNQSFKAVDPEFLLKYHSN